MLNTPNASSHLIADTLTSLCPRQRELAIIEEPMLVLFSIAMICFFSLFSMLVILLRQAKAEGAAARADYSPARSSGAFGARRRQAPLDLPSKGDLKLTLSSLVPQKQPDFRFMVREGGRAQRGIPGEPAAPVRNRPVRPDWAHFNADLGDLRDPQSAMSQPNVARRA